MERGPRLALGVVFSALPGVVNMGCSSALDRVGLGQSKAMYFLCSGKFSGCKARCRVTGDCGDTCQVGYWFKLAILMKEAPEHYEESN